MGLALADRAARRGAEVTLVAANVTLPSPPGVRRIDVETAAELQAALEREFPSVHVLLMAAAPADFRPRSPAGEKIAREGSGGLELDLQPTEDILASVGADRRPDQTVVGFAAETLGGGSSASRPGPPRASALERAREKLARKGADAIVLNDVSRGDIGFESERNEVVIVEADAETPIPLGAKQDVAYAILNRVEAIRSGERSARR
jgi:phosphopantothenoylcysteine decarboxylase/phosphopantothenate--cysteine ligase